MDPILKLRMDAKSVVSDTDKGSSAKGINGQARELLALLDAEPRESTRDQIIHLCKTIVGSYQGLGQFKAFTSGHSIHHVSQGGAEIEKLTVEEVIELVNRHRPQQAIGRSGQGSDVFIGHGRSQLWNVVARHLVDDYSIQAQTFERNAMSGQQVIPTIEKMLDASGFAIIVATMEDEAEDGMRARQNVVHEIGLFQGRLGFDRVAILVQEGLKDFSNIDGLQVVYFKGEDIDQTFYKLGKQLKQFGYQSVG